ncbi:NAD(P)/FAD-dependent oxidoreductase, partial [Anaerolinea sp.]|uniref:NAD(P)/FAD-dependent oxidoreductase n=1 Tax=Anaerolinea sp. TaxID=1872519 RepID=UPI002ACE9DA0
MKKLVILGAGTAGTMAANRLSRILNTSEWEITLVDPNPVHYYQPGFLFIPFGVYQKEDAVKPKKAFIPRGGKLIQTAVEEILPSQNKVRLANGETLSYDYLIIATGNDIHPEETPGLAEHEWGKSIHTFYSLEGSVALAEALRNWKGGRLVVNVVENPIKCPVAPLEFLFLADWYFTQRGMR